MSIAPCQTPFTVFGTNLNDTRKLLRAGILYLGTACDGLAPDHEYKDDEVLKATFDREASAHPVFWDAVRSVLVDAAEDLDFGDPPHAFDTGVDVFNDVLKSGDLTLLDQEPHRDYLFTKAGDARKTHRRDSRSGTQEPSGPATEVVVDEVPSSTDRRPRPSASDVLDGDDIDARINHLLSTTPGPRGGAPKSAVKSAFAPSLVKDVHPDHRAPSSYLGDSDSEPGNGEQRNDTLDGADDDDFVASLLAAPPSLSRVGVLTSAHGLRSFDRATAFRKLKKEDLRRYARQSNA